MGDAEQQALIKAGRDDGEGGEKVLGIFRLSNIRPNQWHNLKLRFDGSTITGLIDGRPVLSVTDTLYAHGMAGLLTGTDQKKLSMPYFDNVLIKGLNTPAPKPTSAAPGEVPPLQQHRSALT